MGYTTYQLVQDFFHQRYYIGFPWQKLANGIFFQKWHPHLHWSQGTLVQEFQLPADGDPNDFWVGSCGIQMVGMGAD